MLQNTYESQHKVYGIYSSYSYLGWLNEEQVINHACRLTSFESIAESEEESVPLWFSIFSANSSSTAKGFSHQASSKRYLWS